MVTAQEPNNAFAGVRLDIYAPRTARAVARYLASGGVIRRFKVYESCGENLDGWVRRGQQEART